MPQNTGGPLNWLFSFWFPFETKAKMAPLKPLPYVYVASVRLWVSHTNMRAVAHFFQGVERCSLYLPVATQAFQIQAPWSDCQPNAESRIGLLSFCFCVSPAGLPRFLPRKTFEFRFFFSPATCWFPIFTLTCQSSFQGSEDRQVARGQQMTA